MYTSYNTQYYRRMLPKVCPDLQHAYDLFRQQNVECLQTFSFTMRFIGFFLLAIAGGHKRKSLDEVSILYKELSTKVFTQSAIKGTSSLVWSHAYYDTALWEQLLAEHLGDKVLIKTMRDPNAPKVRSLYIKSVCV